MLKKKLGFTLMELLAVVLIIATLTSVALPKYRRTVERASSTEALVNLRSLYDSAKRYHAASSSFANKLQGLDVSFFDASSQTSSQFLLGKYEYRFEDTRISACRTNGNYCFRMYYRNSTLGRDILVCELTSTGGKYDWLCETLGDNDPALSSNQYLIRR